MKKLILFLPILLLSILSSAQDDFNTLDSYNDNNFGPASSLIQKSVVHEMNSKMINTLSGYIEFDVTRTYSAGEHVVLYSNDLYICINNHAAGAWNATDFKKLTNGGIYVSYASGVGIAGVQDTPQTITFSGVNIFNSTSYALTIRCYDANGDNVNYKVTAKTTSNFDVTPYGNCTIEYVAKLP